jgi:RimJ/RimL family protein N-acetyltransferase
MVGRADKLTGHKVVLKPFLESDITSAYISWLNDPEVVKYSNQRFIQHTESSCRAYLDGFRCTPNLFLSVRTLSGDSLIGTMTTYFDPNHGTADIGIMIGDKTKWSGGYGQDAWDTLLRHLIKTEQVRKVTAGTMAPNQPMIKVIERSGMTLESNRYQHELLDGQPVDILYFSVFKNQTK